MGEKGWEEEVEYKQAKIWRPSKELCWMITAIRIVWSACQYVRLVDVDICQVGWQGHGRGGSYDPATYQHWGEIAIWKNKQKNKILLLNFNSYVLRDGLPFAVYLFLEQSSSRGVGSKKKNWKCFLPSILIILYGLRRGEVEDSDKWELPAPSLVQGISTFRRGEALVSWYCFFLGAEGR